MTNISTMYPKPHLRGSDLKGKAATVQISAVEQIELWDIQAKDHKLKWVAYFEGKTKYLVLNETTSNQIAEALGSTETDDWIGQAIKIHAITVKAFGKQHEVIRLVEEEKKDG